MRPITRREFLTLVGKGILGASVMRMLPALSEENLAVYAQSHPLAAVAAGSNEDSARVILKSALDALGGLERFVKPGLRVAIKPNATWAYPPGTASSSDPELLRAMIQMVKEAGAGSIIVMDHCSIEPGTSEALRVSGIGKIVQEEDVENLFPDRNNAHPSTYEVVGLPAGRAYTEIGVISEAVKADLRINMGLAKSHNVTKVTMALKHMMGFLRAPGLLHAQLEQGIADLSTPSPIQAQLHILEALRVRLPYGSYRVCAGPETELTNPNVVRRMNQVIAGTDPVLMDAYGCINYFDMLPEELPYILRAAESGAGSADLESALQDGRFQIVQVGMPLPTPTQPAPTAVLQQESITLPPAGPVGTPTAFPTATPLPPGAGLEAVGINAASAESCTQPIVDARPFLNMALIPAAGVLVGAGVVAASQSRKRSDKDDESHAGQQ